MKLQTIIFDMDGTLLDSVGGLMHSTNVAMEKYGYPTHSYEAICGFVGNGAGKLIERALPGGLQNPDYDKCMAAFQEDYKTTMFTNTKPYPGILSLLETLRAEGYRVAVVSNKMDGAVKELSAHFFGDLIPVAIGERPGVARKPAPDSVYAALEELGMPRETAAYVGDSEVDLQTARNAELPCLSVDWGTRSDAVLLQNGATSISRTVEELLVEIRDKR